MGMGIGMGVVYPRGADNGAGGKKTKWKFISSLRRSWANKLKVDFSSV